MQKRWIKVALAAAAMFVIVVVLVPLFVNADTFRPTLETQLSSAMGRKIALGHLSLSLLRGSIVAQNISIADDPAFSTSPFIEAKSLHIGVELGPLLFHRQVRITKLTIESPAISLIQAQNGTWNFSSLGSASAAQAPQSQSALPDLTVGELKIKDGSATVSSLPPTAKPFVYTAINVDVQKFSFLKSFPFQLSAKLPGDGSFNLNGSAGPLAQKNAADTPFQATLQIKHFDPVAAGVVEPSAGISMVVDIDAQLASDGTALTSNGKVQTANLKLARNGSPAPHPVDIDYNISDNLDARTGKVSDIALHTGSVAAHVTGGFRITPQAIVLDLHLAAPNLPVDQLQQLLPVVGVKVPSGSSLRGGTLTANLAITGPATAVTLTGPVEIDNTQLAGFDLGSKIEGLNPFGGSGGGTNIQLLRSDVTSSPQSTQLAKISANLPQVGTATGNGTVASSGALNFNLAAKFNPNTGVGMIANQAKTAVSTLMGSFGSFASKIPINTSNGIPLTITGTSTNPKIRANLKAMLK
jgi:AsmA protein